MANQANSIVHRFTSVTFYHEAGDDMVDRSPELGRPVSPRHPDGLRDAGIGSTQVNAAGTDLHSAPLVSIS